MIARALLSRLAVETLRLAVVIAAGLGLVALVDLFGRMDSIESDSADLRDRLYSLADTGVNHEHRVPVSDSYKTGDVVRTSKDILYPNR